jgi:hypothetical protein
MKLVSELSHPTFHINPVGKIVVDKAPDGVRSPNLADALVIRMAPGIVVISQDGGYEPLAPSFPAICGEQMQLDASPLEALDGFRALVMGCVRVGNGEGRSCVTSCSALLR